MYCYQWNKSVSFFHNFIDGNPGGNSENIQVFVLTCIVKISLDVFDVTILLPKMLYLCPGGICERERVIQCAVREKAAEVICPGCHVTCYCSAEHQVRKTFHRGSTVDM